MNHFRTRIAFISHNFNTKGQKMNMGEQFIWQPWSPTSLFLMMPVNGIKPVPGTYKYMVPGMSSSYALSTYTAHTNSTILYSSAYAV